MFTQTGTDADTPTSPADHVQVLLMLRDHSFPRQIFPNSACQFAKFRTSPRQIFHM